MKVLKSFSAILMAVTVLAGTPYQEAFAQRPPRFGGGGDTGGDDSAERERQQAADRQREQEAREQAEREQRDRQQREQAERDRFERDRQREEQERRQNDERERQQREQAEREQRDRQQQNEERERQQREQAERDRFERDRQREEQERRQSEERERQQREQAERDRWERDQQREEQERWERERQQREQQEQWERERNRSDQERWERERQQQEEQDRWERERQQREQQERWEREERDRRERENEPIAPIDPPPAEEGIYACEPNVGIACTVLSFWWSKPHREADLSFFDEVKASQSKYIKLMSVYAEGRRGKTGTIGITSLNVLLSNGQTVDILPAVKKQFPKRVAKNGQVYIKSEGEMLDVKMPKLPAKTLIIGLFVKADSWIDKATPAYLQVWFAPKKTEIPQANIQLVQP